MRSKTSKSNLFSVAILASAGFSGLPAFADDVAAGEPVIVRVQAHQGADGHGAPKAHRDVPARKVSYLGVGTSPARPELTSQLGLPEGVGLIVEVVSPGSPAEAAGVQTYDILQKLDDQLLVNVEQLTTLIRIKPAGTEIELTILRKGQPVQINAKLGERELAPEPAVWMDRLGEITELRDIPGLKRLREIPELQRLPELRFQEMRDRIAQGLKEIRPRIMRILPQGDRVIIHSDGKQTIRVETNAEGRRVTVTDADGKTIFSGPFNTDEEKSAIDSALRAQIEKLESDFAPPVPPTPPDAPAAPGPASDANNAEPLDTITM
jgi:YD repeat-containing protein